MEIENHAWRTIYTPIITELQLAIRVGKPVKPDQLVEWLVMLRRNPPP